MHFGMWRILLSVEHQIGFLWHTDKWQRGSLKKKGPEMSEWTGGGGDKRGRWERETAANQPRMRLDFPPGGFLRPDGIPAAASSVGGASSGGSWRATGSLKLFSNWGQTEGYYSGTSDAWWKLPKPIREQLSSWTASCAFSETPEAFRAMRHEPLRAGWTCSV